VTIVAENEADNMISKGAISELWDLWDEILALEAEIKEGEHKGEKVSFSDLCARQADKPAPYQCVRQSPLAFWDYNRTLFDLDTDIVASVNQVKAECCHFAPFVAKESIFGGMSVGAAAATSGAEALSLQVMLEQHRVADSVGEPLRDLRVDAWEEAFTKLVRNFAKNSKREYHPDCEQAFDEAIAGTFAADGMLVTISYMVITFYAAAVLATNNNVSSDASLGPLCVITTGLSVVAGFGLCLFFIPFSLVVNSVVFVLLGIGVDDAFVIIAAIKAKEREMARTTWQQTGKRLGADGSVDAAQEAIIEKVAAGLAVAGASITLTSATDFVSFIVGTSTVIPALSAFCVYAAVTIAFDFFLQCTLFVAFVVYNEKRKIRGQRDCCCGCDVCCACTSAGGVHGSTYFPCGRVQVDTSESGQVESTDPALDEENESFITRLIGTKLPNLILNPAGKASVLLLTAGLLAFGGVGCANLKMEFLYEWFLPGGYNCFEMDNTGTSGCKAHQQTEALYAKKKYFTGNVLPAELYTQEGDYFTYQTELSDMVTNLQANKYIVPGSVDSWQTSFDTYRQTSLGFNPVAADTTTAYHTDLATFLYSSSGANYMDDVKLSADNSTILASRVHCLLVGQKSADAYIRAMDDTRAIAAEATHITAFTFSFPFLFWEGLKVVVSETLRNVGLAALMVFIICCIILADVLGAFLILLNIIMIDVVLLGFMHWIGDYMNMVTAINLVLAIGLCVDYSAHVCHSFIAAQGTRDERARHALKTIGVPVFNGGLTTLLATFVLSVASSYVFQVFFRMFLLIVIFGLYFGMVVLPVILSLVGPAALPIDEKAQVAGNIDNGAPALPGTKVMPDAPDASTIARGDGDGDAVHEVSDGRLAI
jgi:predicted RND superfamily exporter protein